jgi:peroxiredoxin Q/BCP
MPMPTDGDRAPRLVLADPEGRLHDLAALEGRPVVVFFYPRAATPG